MTSGGNKFTLVYGGQAYYFDSLLLSFGGRAEETPMLNGTLYRVRQAAGRKDMKLKGRLPFTDISVYSGLITAFSTGVRNFTLNGDSYTKWTLLSGKISSEEKGQFAVCELVLAEVAE